MKPKDLYRALCSREEGLPVFLQPWWLDAVTPSWNVAVALKGEQVTGVWPYALQQRFTVTMMRNPRLTPYLGPHIFFPADIKPTNRDSFEHEAVAQLLEQLPDADVWVQSTQPGMKQVGLFRNQGLRVAVQQTFLINIGNRSEDEIFHDFKEPLRRNIRQAESELTITEAPDLLMQLHEFQQQTLFRKRVAQHNSPEEMDALLTACLREGKGTLYAARQGGRVQAILWNVWDAHTSYYFAGAKDPSADDHRAMSALLWHAIKAARARGNRYFDLEGSQDLGVERFFRGFCGRRELYLMLRKNDHWLWKLSRLFRREA